MMRFAKIILLLQAVICFLIPPLFINASFQAGLYSYKSKAFVRALDGKGGEFASDASRLEFAREITEFFDGYRAFVPVVFEVFPLLLAVSGLIGYLALRRAQPAHGA